MSNIISERSPTAGDASDLSSAYRQMMKEIIDGCGKSPKDALSDENRERNAALFLNLLQVRDDLARRITAKQLKVDEIQTIIEADQELKKNASLIIGSLPEASLQKWRDSGLNPAAEEQAVSWWWRLDEKVSENRFTAFARQMGRVTLWLVIALSLSYLVEFSRRFIGSGADAITVVTQGFLALLVGGTLIQFARQLVEGTKTESSGILFNIPALSILAGILFLGSLLLWFVQPDIAVYYSNLGATQRHAANYAGAIPNLRRATELNPADATAHYNLGVAYQKTGDYNNAEAEYRAAIKWNRSQYWAYSELARLIILRRAENAEALRIVEDGLNELKNRTVQDGLDDNQVTRQKYGLLVMRGWSYTGLQLYRQAENSLNQAIGEAEKTANNTAPGTRLIGAEAYCLKGKLFDAEKKALQSQNKMEEEKDKERQAACAFFICNQKFEENSLEPDLFGLMQEYLAGDPPDCEQENK
jgi:tetratricopeptide (TPR) repeat protein